MAENVLKLKVQSEEYDAKIKRAAEGIQHFVKDVRESGSTLKESGILARAFLQELGNMETVAKGGKQQLREMSNALVTLTDTYRGLSDAEKSSGFGQELNKQIQILTERAGNMKDAMLDVEQSITNAASDTRAFDQVSGAMQGMTAGFQTVQGAAKLMGIQLGDDVEVIAKLQAAMAVTSGFQTMQNLLQKQSALMQGVNALQKEFNILAKANPYVLLATAAAAVVTAYYAWTSGARDAEKAQKALNGEIEATRTQLSQIDKDTDFSVGVAEAAGKSWKAIHELRLEAARTKLQLADMNYDKLAASGNASAEQMKEAADMQKAAWDNVMKVLNEGTIHEVKMRHGGGKSGKGSSVDNKYASDSIMAQQKEVDRLTDAWNRADASMRDGILKDLDAAKAKLEAMKNGVDGGELREVVVTGRKSISNDKTFEKAPINQDSINTYIGGIKEQLKTADIGTPLYESLTEKIKDAGLMSETLKAAFEGGVSGADLSDIASNLKNRLLQDGEISDDVWDALEEELNAKLSELGVDPIKLDVDTGKVIKDVKKVEKEVKGISTAASTVASVVGSIGQAFNSIEDPAAKVAGTVAQAIATLAAGYATATTQASSMGPWAWIAFAATGLATLISTVSSIHNITGYAQGGIVQGNTFSGDQVGPVMLDAGEVVLNRSQVGNLAAQMEDSNNNAVGNSHPYVSGEMIYLGMNNYLKRSGRGEIITSRG